jgi:nucleotidyltransferase/DNA polymerase involved in DNA repair
MWCIVVAANYKARAFGIHAGMRLGAAREQCPVLRVLPYEFELYSKISEEIYRIFFQFTNCVEPLSCDEALVEFPDSIDPFTVAQDIRKAVFSKTRCPISVGIGPNVLLAKMATSHAKPNGVCWVQSDAQYAIYETADLTLKRMSTTMLISRSAVSALPGMGWANQKLAEQHNCPTVRDLRRKDA